MLNLPWPVVLASASPRRIELLRTLAAQFEVLPADIDEEALTTEHPVETAIDLACAKARKVFGSRSSSLVIGADTVVDIDNVQLAKPSHAEDAKRMLRLLSGHVHRVTTGVCLCYPSGEQSFSASTLVKFREIGAEEIGAYVATGEPMDKAGAYAIQGGAAEFVEMVVGSTTNVVGLPMEELEVRLRALSA